MEKTLPKSLLAFFWHFVKKQWPWFLLLQIFSFAWSLDHTLFPYVVQLLIDAISGLKDDRSQVWQVVATPLLLGGGLWIFVELFYRLTGFTNMRVSPQLEADVRMEMFQYAQHHSHNYFATHYAGSLSNKLADMPESMTQVLQLVIFLFLPVCLAIAISAGFFLSLSPIFAFILLGWIVLHITACLFFSRKCTRFSHIHAEAKTLLQGKIVDSFTNHLNIKLFARHRYEQEHLQSFQNDEQKKHKVSLYAIEKMKIVIGLLAFLFPGVVINLYMIYAWQKGEITTGEVVFIFNSIWNITMMTTIASLELPNFFRELGICRQALTIIQDAHEIKDLPEASPITIKEGNITFEHVSFNYVPNYNIFQDKTLSINAGDKVGLVGFSGSGKTTFVQLILRFFNVEKGRILIDGQDISKITHKSLCSQIAMIPQDTCLFHRTLMENIRYGRLTATDEEVIAASKQAHCHDFIMKLPDGYNTLAGERGVKLSGGQRQRIAIARAILKNAPILILDEATSALDSVTESQIQSSLQNLMDQRTCIVIAHRLSTLAGMHRILVFKDGKIVEEGSHEDLITSDGHYAQMWNMQASGFLPDLGDLGDSVS